MLAAQNWRGANRRPARQRQIDAARIAEAGARRGRLRSPRSCHCATASAGCRPNWHPPCRQCQSAPADASATNPHHRRLRATRLVRTAANTVVVAVAQGTGLLVTSHTPTGIPTLIRLRPIEHLVEQAGRRFVRRVSTGITPADVAASHACHGSNVREIFFDLYDRHERLRRTGVNTWLRRCVTIEGIAAVSVRTGHHSAGHFLPTGQFALRTGRFSDQQMLRKLLPLRNIDRPHVLFLIIFARCGAG